MNNDKRLKFMRDWLKDLQTVLPENDKKIECLSWAIKKCQSSVNRKRDTERSYW